MTFHDLRIGDVFKVAGHPGVDEAQLWRKVTAGQARAIPPLRRQYTFSITPDCLVACRIEVVERSDDVPIRRAGNTLVLKGGDVLLERLSPFSVYRTTPCEKWVEFILTGQSIYTSKPERMPDNLAVPFLISTGGKALGRPTGSMVFTYHGRIYARLTRREVTGKASARPGVYKRIITVDGAKRQLLVGALSVPDDCALFDIIQEQFPSPAA